MLKEKPPTTPDVAYEDDEQYFHEYSVEKLLHTWKKLRKLTLTDKDYEDPEVFEGKELNKFRMVWFSALLGIVGIILEENKINDRWEENRVKKKWSALARKIKRLNKKKEKSDQDIPISPDLVTEGEQLLRIVEPYVVKLEIELDRVA
ncbi:MAG: hypothetical protein AAB691_05180 [Patescibacteria group bacterium]